jgi:glucosamine-6-phosphate deaminase
MDIRIVKTLVDMGQAAAEMLAERIRKRPGLTLGLPTGASPLPVYGSLIAMYRAGSVDFSRVRTVNLDEYIGLPGGHRQSFRFFMDEHLFGHINIDPSNTHFPDGAAARPEAECARYDRLIDDLGGIQAQLLGIGRNGHIGFNEPSDVFSARTSAVALSRDTVLANSVYFGDPSEVPGRAVTMGIKQIMLAEHIVLVGGGEKREIVERAAYGEITPRVPASVLQLHRSVSIILSEETAGI